MINEGTTTSNVETPAPDTGRGDRLAPGDGLIIGLLMASASVVLLNEMLLGVALPTLIIDLGITPSIGQWVTTAYLLTMAVLIPATGFIMRRYQLRTIFLTAMSLFTVGTTVGALAPGIELLLAGRIIQAVGTAVFVPLLITTTMRLAPASRRGRLMALATAIPGIAPALGPALAGILLSQLNWRWLFILMLPIAITALAMGAAKLRNITTPEPITLDILSLLLSATGFGALVYGLSLIGEAVSGHSPIAPWLPIAIGLAGVTAFVWRQIVLQRGRGALLDMRIFGARSFVVSSLVMFVVCVNGFGTLIVLPLVLTAVTGIGTFALGLFMVPGGVIITIVSALSGRVYDRYGPLPLAIPGAIILTATFWLFTRIDEGTSVWTILTIYLVMSGAQALIWGPMTTTALASLRAELQPHGSAAFGTIQQLAGAVGGAILVSAYTIGADASHAGALTQAQAVSAAHTAFTTAATIAFAAVLGTLFVGKNQVR